jgi:hypothetical protein
MLRLGVKNGSAEPTSDLQPQPVPTTSLTRPAAAQAAPPASKVKRDVLSTTSLATGKPPLSSQSKPSARPPLPPPNAHSLDASASRARRPSLEEGVNPVLAPSSCSTTRAPTSQQLRADAVPIAVMNYVAEADALVAGR